MKILNILHNKIFIRQTLKSARLNPKLKQSSGCSSISFPFEPTIISILSQIILEARLCLNFYLFGIFHQTQCSKNMLSCFEGKPKVIRFVLFQPDIQILSISAKANHFKSLFIKIAFIYLTIYSKFVSKVNPSTKVLSIKILYQQIIMFFIISYNTGLLPLIILLGTIAISSIIKIQMNNFGFPQSNNYAQSQVTSNQGGYETNFTGVQNGGLFTRDECRNLARKIIETYDGNGDGICETIEVAKWLVDCYRAMNKSFQPTATDIASYVQIVDKNRNGKVTRDELEQFIIRYFFNPNRVA